MLSILLNVLKEFFLSQTLLVLKEWFLMSAGAHQMISAVAGEGSSFLFIFLFYKLFIYFV